MEAQGSQDLGSSTGGGDGGSDFPEGRLAAQEASCLFQRPAPVDFSFNPLADKTFLFWDPSLLEAVKMGDPHTHEFFRLLSLCHTVMSEEKNEGELRDSSAAGTAQLMLLGTAALPCCCAGLPGQGRWLDSGHFLHMLLVPTRRAVLQSSVSR